MRYLILDTSGSMTYRCSSASPTPRRDVMLHSIQLLLATQPLDDGLPVICTSANGVPISAVATRASWEAISQQISWAGSSFLMPGYRAAAAAHAAAPAGQRCVTAIVSDGEAHDAAALCREAAERLPDDFYMALCLLGEGPNFERAAALFQQLSASQPRVTVVRLPAGAGAPAVALALEGVFSGSAWFAKEL